MLKYFGSQDVIRNIFILLLCTSAAAAPLQAQARSPVVVLDPGHGGSDEGAVAYHPSAYGVMRVAEKNITLTLALSLAQRLRREGVTVFLTRESDRDTPLAARTAAANRKKADLFLSLHLNSAHPTRVDVASGVETYILNGTSDAGSKRLAKMDSSVFSEYDTGGQSDIAVMLKDLRLGANLSQSKRLACMVQRRLVEAAATQGGAQSSRALHVRSGANSGGTDRGVKQALFHVLLGADMPSVLVEAGFISSSQDRARLLSGTGQRRIVDGLSRAITEYWKLKNTRLASNLTQDCQIRGQ